MKRYTSLTDPAEYVQIPSELRQDYFIDPACTVFQNRKHFCFNSDSTALAEFCKVHPGERIAEIGTNNGALLVYFDRFSPSFLGGIEILQEPARLAAFNLARSVKAEWTIWNASAQEVMEGDFDLVVCNPPFFPLSSLQEHETPLSLRQLARFEQNLDLETMTASAFRLLRSYGRFCFVHRPERLCESLECLSRHHLQPSRIQIVYDRRDQQAKAVLIEAVREGSCLPKIEPPLFRG